MLDTNGAALRGRVGGHGEICGVCRSKIKVRWRGWATNNDTEEKTDLICKGEGSKYEAFGYSCPCVAKARRGDHSMQIRVSIEEPDVIILPNSLDSLANREFCKPRADKVRLNSANVMQRYPANGAASAAPSAAERRGILGVHVVSSFLLASVLGRTPLQLLPKTPGYRRLR